MQLGIDQQENIPMSRQEELLVQSDLRILIESEDVLNDHPATVKVYFHGQLAAQVNAIAAPQSGADGAEYPAVILQFAP